MLFVIGALEMFYDDDDDDDWPPVLPPQCGVYDGADYTSFILLKMRFVRGID